MSSTDNSTENASPPAPSQDSAPPPPPKDSAPPPKQSPPPPPPKADESPPPASSPPPPSPEKPPPPPPTKDTPPPPPPASPEKPQSPPPPSETPKTPVPPTTTPPSQDPTPAPPADSKPPPQVVVPPTVFPPPSVPERGSTPSLGPPPSTPADRDHSGGGGDSGSKGGIGTDEIIVIASVTGAFLLLLVAALVCVICIKKKKEKKPPGKMQYYGDPSRAPRKGSNYYDDRGHNQNWYGTPSSKEHGHPGYKGTPGGGWGGAPLQTPSSGEMSGNFSDPSRPNNPAGSPNLAFGFNKSSFTYDELAAATDNFSQPNLLGQGGFGFVHKGVFPNGKVVAVKSLKSGSGQGEREFQAEVDIISRVHHRHLVSLVGYCIAGGQRMLVYEFVPNGNLEQHLHANYKGVTLDWSKRLNIGIGSAKGLAYLHEDCHPRIIHRDIKAANILLDDNYEAMVADFGLAKLTTDNITHVSTRVMGTFGYMAPEYASSGKLTEKSDVYSFGVMLLELITGRRPLDTSNRDMDDSLVDWARPILTKALGDDNFEELIDTNLENKYNHNEVRRMIACASASIRHSAKRRPKMSQIVRALEGDVSLDDLNDVTRTNQSSSSTPVSSVYDTRAYNEDMKKFRKVLESQIEGDDNGGNPYSSSDEASSREMK